MFLKTMVEPNKLEKKIKKEGVCWTQPRIFPKIFPLPLPSNNHFELFLPSATVAEQIWFYKNGCTWRLFESSFLDGQIQYMITPEPSTL